jgi:hypothetical protein
MKIKILNVSDKILNLAFTTIAHRNTLNNTFINGKKRQAKKTVS